ncbi:MAG TPA: ABC transporter ATP-binding protein [Syntrophobacteria bacterium]|nr:ABC transporter ATP-binding protein [Syntrophobacteria bacterium]
MIELNRVTKVYPGAAQPAVDNVSLTVPEGEICVFIGPSGCGKTTLMRLINRLIPLTSGSISVDGKDVMSLDPIELRRHMGYVIQQVGLFSHMTVRENIATVPKLLGWTKARIDERVDELLTLVNLEPKTFRDRYPRQLSGGQAQRVGVARAMAANPPIMLMDEPFGAIDPINRETLQEEFLRIQEKLKKTIIFVTHDINEAIKMGQRLALLKDGRLVQSGLPDELLVRPADEFVKNFVGADRLLKRLNLLKVKDAMMADPVHCLDTDPSERILEEMIKHDLAFLIVATPDQHLSGYVNQYDLRGHKGRVGEVVRKLSLTVSPERNLKEALSQMLSYDLGILVVIDAEGRIQGVLNSATLWNVVGDTYDERGGHWARITAGGRIL